MPAAIMLTEFRLACPGQDLAVALVTDKEKALHQEALFALESRLAVLTLGLPGKGFVLLLGHLGNAQLVRHFVTALGSVAPQLHRG